MLEKVARMNDLYDIYGPLLTEKQKMIFELYYQDDWSLGEIAEEETITRQAVHDILRRVAALLEEYEEKLNFFVKFQQVKKGLAHINAIIYDWDEQPIPDPVGRLKEETSKIVNLLG